MAIFQQYIDYQEITGLSITNLFNLPKWTNGTRPNGLDLYQGTLGFNTSANIIEWYTGTGWVQPGSGGGGGVTSVGLFLAPSMSSIFNVSNSPITTSGDILMQMNLQAGNLVLASDAGGGSGTPTFRSLVVADIPPLPASKITSGIFPIIRGGTGLSALGTNGQLIRVNASATALEYFSPSYLTSFTETDPIFTAHDAFAVTSGLIANWNAAYNDKVVSIGFSGSGTKTLTLTQQDGGTLTASFTDLSGSGGLSDADYGDITVSGAGTVMTIDNNVVTNTKLADVPTATFKGRNTSGTGDPEDLTVTQATALLNLYSSTLKGLVPASGGGTANFLRADGTWAAPPSNYILNQTTLQSSSDFHISGLGNIDTKLLIGTTDTFGSTYSLEVGTKAVMKSTLEVIGNTTVYGGFNNSKTSGDLNAIFNAANTTNAANINLIVGNSSGTSTKYAYISFYNNDTSPMRWDVGTYGSNNFVISDYINSKEILRLVPNTGVLRLAASLSGTGDDLLYANVNGDVVRSTTEITDVFTKTATQTATGDKTFSGTLNFTGLAAGGSADKLLGLVNSSGAVTKLDFASEFTLVSNVFALTTQMSLTKNSSGIKLVNDQTSPGNYMAYGTSSAGTKGFVRTVHDFINDYTDSSYDSGGGVGGLFGMIGWNIANHLTGTGDVVSIMWSGTIANTASTKQLRVYAGVNISYSLDLLLASSGTQSGAASNFVIEVMVTRTGATSTRITTKIDIADLGSRTITTVDNTGVSFTNYFVHFVGNVTGTSPANGDIVYKHGVYLSYPAL